MTTNRKESTMPFAIGAVVAIGQVEAGITAFTQGEDGPAAYPVIGWASVVTGHTKQGHAQTQVQPLFLFDGTPTTADQYRAEHGPDSITDIR
ncbi:hypothetical protein [Streptomyces zhihengii]